MRAIRSNHFVRIVVALVAAALLAAACGGDDDTDAGVDADTDAADASMEEPAAVEEPAAPDNELCGDRELRIAHVDGFGANTWRQITAAELRDELSQCPNVTLEYAQADFDLPTYISAINSYVAQGFDAIITYDDFGNQALDTLRQAHEAGVVVVPYISDPGGVVGEDYDGYVEYDFAKEGADMGDWLHDLYGGEGELVFVGGIPGNPASQALYDLIEARLEELGSSIVILNETPIDTNWDPAEEQRVMAGVLTQYPSLNMLASDYGVASKGGIRAFVNAGVPLPPLATSASDNELGCLWQELRPDNPDFELLSLDGTTRVVRIAGRKALAALNGLPDNEPELAELIRFIDTANGIDPPCEPSLPPDADLSSALSVQQLQELFGGMAMDDDAPAAADDDTAAAAGGPVPTEALCGEGDIRVAHIDGFGANAWRQITAAELRDELSACPNVTVEYTQADFDLPTFVSAINSYVAQGFDAIVVYDDFGNQALDALRSAYEAGVVVVPYIADPSGVDGEDYTKFIPMNNSVASAIWAEWFHEVLDGEGELIFVGGIPGNPSSLELMAGFEATADELGGGLTFLNDEPIDTNWDPAEAQRVMAGTLTQYGDQMQGVVSDYGVASVGGIRSMLTASYPIPPLATLASSNELGCVYQELVADNPDFELVSIDGTTRVVRLAGRLALSELSGVPTGDPEIFELFTFMDTLNDLEPPCEPDLPPDADLSSALSVEQLKELFE